MSSTDGVRPVAAIPPFLGQRPEEAEQMRWQSAVSELGPERAAAACTEPFAIGLDLPDGRTFIAVDRFAVKTLCYRLVGSKLRFAARADELADTDASLDPQAIFDYMYFHVIPSPRTIYRDVYRLPPGHYALLDRGHLKVAPYWTPTFVPEIHPSYSSMREEFRRLLAQAVRRELDGSKPACFLSGGTDSSTVAGMIGEVAGCPAATFAIGFDAAGYDEMEYARLAARHFGTEHHEYYVTPEDLVRAIPRVAASYDQPFGNSSALPAYYCALQARDHGVTHLLAGDGGDELFGGNSRYAMQRVFSWYGKVPAMLRRGVIEPTFGLDIVRRTPLVRKGSGYIRHARVPMPDRLQIHNLLQHLGADEVLSTSLLERVDPTSVMRQQRDVWLQAGAESDTDRALAFDWRYTLAENDLPKVRGTAQLAGVSVGFPLLDRDLLDFSLRMPTDYKLRGLRLRWFFKEALRGFLPDRIIAKRKHGFGLPFGEWALRHPPLLEMAAESLRGLAERGLVRPKFVETLLGTHLVTHPGYYGEMVWILMMLEQWLRAHVPNYRCPA